MEPDKAQKQPHSDKKQDNRQEFPGYPHYSQNEDIYRQEEELDIDPETHKPKENPLKTQETSMDVPGDEDDDAEEAIGSEDEENNYYSLGGDDKDSLEEQREDFTANRDEDQKEEDLNDR